MMNSVNYQNQQIPANYSGVTINVTNPALVANGRCANYPTGQNCVYTYPQQTTDQNVEYIPSNTQYVQQPTYNYQQPVQTPQPAQMDLAYTQYPARVQQPAINSNQQPSPEQGTQNYPAQTENYPLQSYPPQYYINNYNTVTGQNTPNTANNEVAQNTPNVPYNTNTEAKNTAPIQEGATQQEKQEDSQINGYENSFSQPTQYEESDLSVSKEVINKLETREAEQKELEKNGEKTKVVTLTNEYIMSLENYLNNPNSEIRLMASKEILTRLDEDRDRYNDAALNALLNKMLQDPDKLVRIAALSAFSSGLASGNDYTVELLNRIQADPNSDKEDVLEAAQILLKRSTSTETKYVPAQAA